jgi:hypothetical protein
MEKQIISKIKIQNKAFLTQSGKGAFLKLYPSITQALPKHYPSITQAHELG